MLEKKEHGKDHPTYKTSKWIAVMTAICMSAMLAGCGNTNTVDTQAETTVTTQAAAAENETAAETAQAEMTTETVQAEASEGNENAPAGTEESENNAAAETQTNTAAADSNVPEISDIEIKDQLENTADGEHVITADGETAEYSNTQITKSGEADGDEADFYGENSAIFAANGGTLTLSDMVISTNGTHANAVFSYGEGTTVNISDSVIETSGNCSGGIMTTGGGTMNAENLNIHTTGNSSAAIRSDRGGGTVTVTGGQYVTDGTGSPVIYSTADITVNDAEMISTASQGVVVEGKNSVMLNNVTLTADNNTKNSDKSDTYQAVMIYQSMSGDAAEGLSSFTMNGGTLTNKNGDIFFVNNTVTEIALSGAEIINEDADGVFLRAEAAGWGNEGSNGGQVTLTADAQEINEDMIVDEVSHLNLYLKNDSVFNGAVNTDGQAGEVYVELDADATWTLTADSYITSLTCDEDAIVLNGHTLYVNGEAYTEGTASTGEAIEATVTAGSVNGEMGTPPEGAPGEGGEMGNPPDGAPGSDGSNMGTPPEKPDGDVGGGPGNGGTPPEKPDGNGKPAGDPPAKPGTSETGAEETTAAS